MSSVVWGTTFCLLIFYGLINVESDSSFQPYIDHGGTVVALAGENYCILGCDSRLSEKYFIHSRCIPRMSQIEKGVVLSAAGCLADFLELSKLLQHESRIYVWESEKCMPLEAFSHLLSNVLYTRRTFPFLAFTLLSGLDKSGHGAVYKYDCLGSYQRVLASCAGRGEHLIQPMLDGLVNNIRELASTDDCDAIAEADADASKLWSISNDGDVFESPTRMYISEHQLSQKKAVELVVQAFRAAAEREISLGDSVRIWELTSNGIRESVYELPAH